MPPECYPLVLKMWWLTLVLHIIVETRGAEHSIVAPTAYCTNKLNVIYVEITRRFLEDQHYITGIETLDSQDGIQTTLQCTLDGFKKPLVLYTLQEFLQQVKRNQQDLSYDSDINPYSQLEGYLTRGTYETFMQSVIPNVAYCNPLAKLLLIGLRISRHQIIEMFRLAWVQYDVPNMLVVNRVDNSSIECCLFNPYLSESNVVDGRNVNCQFVHSLDEVDSYIQYTKEFYLHRVHNLHRHPLRIAIADVDLMSLAVYKNGKIERFSYLDGEIVDIMKRKMNFSTEFVILPSQLSTGFVYPNGSLGGSLDLIERDQIDLAANSRIIHSYNIKSLQYLRQLTTTKLVFIIPKNYYQSRSRDRVFFNTFTWSFYAINILIAAVFPLLLKAVDWKSEDSRKESYSSAVMYTLAVTLAVSTKLPKRMHARMVICGIMLYALVSYSIWQAITIKRLNSNNDHLDDIQSLDELLDSKLIPKIPVAYGYFIRPKQEDYSSMDSLHKKLYKEATVANNNVTGAKLIEDMLAKRSSAVLIHDLRAGVVKARFFDDERMQSLIHQINQHVFEFYTAMALPKDSPLLEEFNRITTSCVESGIVQYQLAKIEFKEILYMIAKNRDNRLLGISAGAKRFDLGVWRNVFYFYLVLNALAVVLFFGEVLVHRGLHRKQQFSKNYNRCDKDEVQLSDLTQKRHTIRKRYIVKKKNVN